MSNGLENEDIQFGFGSDNHSSVHPKLLEAIVENNQGHLPSYGTDPITTAAKQAFCSLFGCDLDVYFVFNGSAANTLAIKALTQSFHKVICSEQSHIKNDECNAPEFFTGCQLLAIPTKDGKLTVDAIEPFMERLGDQHTGQPGLLSITQPTELGTVYTPDEISDLSQFAKKNGLRFHIDGARLSNAVASLKTDFKTMFTDQGVDVISFGGTKNGLLYGEAILFFNKENSRSFKYLRKQCLQLPSKTRFISAQFLRYLNHGLWKEIAEHSIDMAAYLGEGLANVREIQITQKIESNAVFVTMPQAWVKPLRKRHFFYIWNPKTVEARLMTTFDTSREQIDLFLKDVKTLSEKGNLESDLLL